MWKGQAVSFQVPVETIISVHVLAVSLMEL
jgi:hypothetical protein